MNALKKWLGLIWILLGPFTIFFLIRTAAQEIAKKPVIDTKIQWLVFVVIFIPIAVGMTVFGFYALKGEYDRLPENSTDTGR